MSNLSRANIAYNLEISPHKLSISYYSHDLIYVFSSQLYKEKFKKALKDNRKKISDSLSNRFGINYKCNELADLKLYTSIEKRGFLIYKEGEKYNCPDCIILDGNKMIMKN